jgi:hypothetical protein
MSAESNTGYRHAITGQWTPLTGERVGYWGAPDASYPRVGNLYYGGIEVYNYGNPTEADGTTTLNPEVDLPRDTRVVVDRTRANRTIRCFWFHPADGSDGEFTGSRFAGNACPTNVTAGGLHGWRFLPTTHDGRWQVPGGYGISLVFPIISSAPLLGYANPSSPDCIVGSVWAAGGGTPDGRVWDAPTAGEVCPLPQYHGTAQPVTVRSLPNTSPSIRRVRPADGARLHDRTPLIRAIVTDRETDLAKRHIRLYVDGTRISRFSYDQSTGRLAHQAKRLSYGSHKLRIVARDSSGRTAIKATDFRIVR